MALIILVVAMPITVGAAADLTTGEADGKAYVLGDVLYETLAGVSGYCFAEDGTPMNKVVAQMRADANCDGIGDKADITNFREFLIGKKNVALTNVNNDGNSDICDLVAIVNTINNRK